MTIFWSTTKTFRSPYSQQSQRHPQKQTVSIWLPTTLEHTLLLTGKPILLKTDMIDAGHGTTSPVLL